MNKLVLMALVGATSAIRLTAAPHAKWEYKLFQQPEGPPPDMGHDGPPTPEDIAKMIMGELDLDGNGVISWEEVKT